MIEDDKNIAELLRLYLEKDGFEVMIAADGGKGLQLATDEHPDVVLLDIMLPVMDGWQVCREIRTSSDVPIIMLTAKGEPYDKGLRPRDGRGRLCDQGPLRSRSSSPRIHAVMRRREGGDSPAAKRLEYDKLMHKSRLL